MPQDNERYFDRVTDAVMTAVLNVSRPHPRAQEINVDMDVVIEAMCRAMALFAASVAQMPGDRDAAAEILANAEKQAVDTLRFLADRIKDGTLQRDPKGRPSLRLVE